MHHVFEYYIVSYMLVLFGIIKLGWVSVSNSSLSLFTNYASYRSANTGYIYIFVIIILDKMSGWIEKIMWKQRFGGVFIYLI